MLVYTQTSLLGRSWVRPPGVSCLCTNTAYLYLSSRIHILRANNIFFFFRFSSSFLFGKLRYAQTTLLVSVAECESVRYFHQLTFPLSEMQTRPHGTRATCVASFMPPGCHSAKMLLQQKEPCSTSVGRNGPEVTKQNSSFPPCLPQIHAPLAQCQGLNTW